jgi:hypothetical protein
MTAFEIITTVLSLGAVGLSIYTLYTQRALQKENNELQRATAELSRKQLELIARDERERAKARITFQLVKVDRSTFKFVLANAGTVAARNVNVGLLLDDAAKSPLIAAEVAHKLPAPILQPGNSVTLNAALHMGSPLAYRAKLTWENADGTSADEETYVSV